MKRDIPMVAFLKNVDGDYPWQTVNVPLGIAYLAGLPAVALLPDGMGLALAGFGLGMLFLLLMMLLTWKWPV